MIKYTLLLLCLFYPAHVFAETCKPVVAVYPSWKHNQATLESLPWHRFTHIALFGVYPNAEGNIKSDERDTFITDTVKLAHARGKKVILSVGGAGEASKAYRTISADKKRREAFAHLLAQYVKQHSLDGVDIDWEYWTFQSELGKGGNDPIESQNLVKLLATVRAALPPDALLTTDIIAGSWLGEQYLPDIEQHVDFVNLMAFDFTGQWDTSPVAHHADYATFKRAIEYAIKRGFSKEKLLVGLPAYGKEFVEGKNTHVKDIPYRHIAESALTQKRLFSRGRIGNTYFESRENIEKKSKYLSKNNFPGVFLFEITSDHPSQSLSLLQVASEILNPESCYDS